MRTASTESLNPKQVITRIRKLLNSVTTRNTTSQTTKRKTTRKKRRGKNKQSNT